MDIKGLIADQMGYFTPYDVAGAVLCIALAALFGFLLAIIAKADHGARKESAVLAAVIAFAVALVRASVPLSIGLVAVALFLGDHGATERSSGRLLRYGVAAVGIGCGSSAAIVVVALLVPIGLLLRWATADRS